MFEWISSNVGNIVAVAALLIIVAFAIRSILRNKKTSCSCGCGACPVADTCHKDRKR